MDLNLRDCFTASWQNHFPGTELPITFEFRNAFGTSKKVPPPNGWRCILCQIGRARNGTLLVLDASSITCRGGLMYTGYSAERPPDFRYFLSHGE